MLNKSKHVMLDLETLSSKPNAVIVSIGAVEFDPWNLTLGREFYRRINIDSHLDSGGHISGSTIEWWMKQEDAARAVFTEGGVPLPSALYDFRAFVNDLRAEVDDSTLVCIWGNGAAFDNVILGCAYDATRIPRPWSYREDRCFRTLRAMYPEVPGVEYGVFHNALDDAKAQALHLFEMITAGSRIG